MKRRIGILGGTFDPIHLGHIYMAKEVLKKLSLKKIIFVPCYKSPHKENIKSVSARHRYNMVRLAIKENRKFSVSKHEVSKKGKSYTIDTIKYFRRKYGKNAELFFIAGSDSLKDVNKWKNLKDILKLSNFVIIKRPKFKIKPDIKNFIILDINAKDVQATVLRNKIKNRKSVKNSISKKVYEYILKHALYKSN